MKKVLIIGGAGYVGSVLVSHLLKSGNQVVVLDNFVYDHHFTITPYIGDPGYRFVKGEMGDTAVLAKASEGVDHVIILAGLVGDPITKSYPELSATINEESVRTCMDFFDDKPIEKLVFVSTCSNYGLIEEGTIADEEFELNPLSLYAKAKVAAEQYLLSKKGKTTYSGVILRFATAFGLSPRMRFDLTVSEFTRDMFFAEELVVFDEHTWRPYCHVRDFARLINMVIDSEDDKVAFEVFNAGGDVNNFTKKMIVDAIASHLPDAPVRYNEKGSDPRNYRVSFKKVKEVLGFEPEYTVEQGIQELINALEIGLYSDSLTNKSYYGNYTIER